MLNSPYCPPATCTMCWRWWVGTSVDCTLLSGNPNCPWWQSTLILGISRLPCRSILCMFPLQNTSWEWIGRRVNACGRVVKPITRGGTLTMQSVVTLPSPPPPQVVWARSEASQEA